jgi:hypothetical protein
LEFLNLRDDALEGTPHGEDAVTLFNALVEAATAGSPLTHVDLSGPYSSSTSLFFVCVCAGMAALVVKCATGCHDSEKLCDDACVDP